MKWFNFKDFQKPYHDNISWKEAKRRLQYFVRYFFTYLTHRTYYHFPQLVLRIRDTQKMYPNWCQMAVRTGRPTDPMLGFLKKFWFLMKPKMSVSMATKQQMAHFISLINIDINRSHMSTEEWRRNCTANKCTNFNEAMFTFNKGNSKRTVKSTNMPLCLYFFSFLLAPLVLRLRAADKTCVQKIRFVTGYFEIITVWKSF